MKQTVFHNKHKLLRGAVALCIAAALLALPFLLIRPMEAGESDLRIGATFGPVYAVMQGVTEGVPGLNLRQMIPPQDICLRSYPLSDWDLYSMAGGYDLIVYGGCGLESFEPVIPSLGEYGVASAGLLDAAALADGISQDPDSHWYGKNPHAYLSLSGAAQMTETAAAAMSALDPAYGAMYQENAERCLAVISGLWSEIPDLSGHSAGILNEALLYPALDSGLSVPFRYERESGEEATGSALNDLIAEAHAAGVSVLLIEKQAPVRMVRALEDAGFTVVRLDVLSALNGGFEAYIAALEANCRALSGAFDSEEP